MWRGTTVGRISCDHKPLPDHIGPGCRGLVSWCDKADGNSQQKEHRCGSRCYRASLGEIHGCPLPRDSKWKSSRATTSAISRVADFSPASPLNVQHDPERTFSPSHGENRGSSPLGSASKIKDLAFHISFLSSVPAVSRRRFAFRSFARKSYFCGAVHKAGRTLSAATQPALTISPPPTPSPP